MKRCFAVLMVLWTIGGTAASELEKVQISHLALYQPDNVLRSRAGVFDDFANYVKMVNVEVENCLKEFPGRHSTLGAVVVVVKPGRRVKVWFAEINGALESDEKLRIVKAVESVPVHSVQSGPLAFAMAFSNGGSIPENARAPIPKEWEDAMPKDQAVYIPDEIMDKIWPEEGES